MSIYIREYDESTFDVYKSNYFGLSFVYMGQIKREKISKLKRCWIYKASNRKTDFLDILDLESINRIINELESIT